MAPKWHPTPESERLTARRLEDDGSWSGCQVSDIRGGDVFQLVDPDGEVVALDALPCLSFALAKGDAIQNDPLGSTGQLYGWGVPISAFASADEATAARRAS